MPQMPTRKSFPRNALHRAPKPSSSPNRYMQRNNSLSALFLASRCPGRPDSFAPQTTSPPSRHFHNFEPFGGRPGRDLPSSLAGLSQIS
jgi:hypothetical protein